jgi:hypothetical protein
MSTDARIRPNVPTFILVGGTFTADTGEDLDSRQPWVEDSRSWMARDTLVESEIWWRAVTSLVFPLLDAEGEDSFALISGIRMVVQVRPDGSIQQRRLTSVLPGGFRTATNSIGRWQYPQLPAVKPRRISDSADQGDLTARIIVAADGFSHRSSYPEFERQWLEQGNVTIVVPHTHATSVYLDGYVAWVADDRPENAPGPLFSRDIYDPTRLSKVVPVAANFRATGVLQEGNWVDPAPLEAARFLLETRFDLKLGIWDLATNDILRSTLLKETPIEVPPTAAAARTAGAIERQQALRADRLGNRSAFLAETVALVGSLAASGWTSSLPDVLAEDPFRRTLPVAVAPDCDAAEARARHPSMRPGKTVLWLQFTIRRDSPGDSKVELMVPAPLSLLKEIIFDPFFKEHLSELEKIAHPNPVTNQRGKGNRSRKHMVVTHVLDRETISYEVMDYDYAGDLAPFKSTDGKIDFPAFVAAYRAKGGMDWTARIADIADRTPAWIDVFAPLAQRCREAITANPNLGRA